MKWKQRTLDELADMICGNGVGTPFVYRSSSYITRFFRDADTDFAHDGSTRAAWVSAVLEQFLLNLMLTPDRRRRRSAE